MGEAIIWEEDRLLVETRKHPRWATFQRECGKVGVFFEVERSSSPRTAPRYKCQAIRYTRVRPDFHQGTVIATVEADHPMRAQVEGFHAAIASGDETAAELDPQLAGMLGDTPAPPDPIIASLLGGPVADPMKDLIG